MIKEFILFLAIQFWLSELARYLTQGNWIPIWEKYGIPHFLRAFLKDWFPGPICPHWQPVPTSYLRNAAASRLRFGSSSPAHTMLHCKPMKTTGNRRKPIKTNKTHCKPMKSTTNHCKPMKTTAMSFSWICLFNPAAHSLLVYYLTQPHPSSISICKNFQDTGMHNRSKTMQYVTDYSS